MINCFIYWNIIIVIKLVIKLIHYNKKIFKLIIKNELLSIIIIIFSAGFVFYSFVDYLNQNPSVHYYKNNDLRTNKTYTISNSLLMFQNNFFCLSNTIFI